MATSLPRRTTTRSFSDGEAIPGSDPSDTTSILLERLQAYKHACGYLESYVAAFEKLEKSHAKEYEKILKAISDPLKEGHHFDQNLGGIAGLFENMRSNTQGIVNAHLENEKNLKGSVLPILERLHTEIKNKSKELSKGTAKGSKEVDKARNTTQKHIEMLGQHTAAFSSSGGKVEPANDPYLLRRGVNHRLHKQVLEENNNRHDLLAVQDSFASFEAHVIATIQQALNAFLQYTGGRLEREKALYADIVSTAQAIPPDFEWKGFVNRNTHILIDPSGKSKSNSAMNLRANTNSSTKAHTVQHHLPQPRSCLHQASHRRFLTAQVSGCPQRLRHWLLCHNALQIPPSVQRRRRPPQRPQPRALTLPSRLYYRRDQRRKIQYQRQRRLQG